MTLTLSPEQAPLEADAHGVVYVAGTRVPIDTIVDAFHAGASPEEVVLSYPSLHLADIYAVIGYYLRHTAEVDVYLEAQTCRAQEARARHRVDETSRELRQRLLIRRVLE